MIFIMVFDNKQKTESNDFEKLRKGNCSHKHHTSARIQTNRMTFQQFDTSMHSLCIPNLFFVFTVHIQVFLIVENKILCKFYVNSIKIWHQKL